MEEKIGKKFLLYFRLALLCWILDCKCDPAHHRFFLRLADFHQQHHALHP
ncbi:MAG: hypothetical protein V8S72_00710 [Oscillospiraceae bacterium]